MFDLVIWILALAATVFVLEFVLGLGQALRPGATATSVLDPGGHRLKPTTTWVHITMAGPSDGQRDHVFQETTKAA
jgi:hypothetical protein